MDRKASHLRKGALSLALASALTLGTLPAAFAATPEAEKAADALHELGIFNGTGFDAAGKPIYDLDRVPTRNEAVTMLVRLLGKEAEAKAGTWETPFTDVADWAKPYVGYAYANGLANGTSLTTFSGDAQVTASQYLTFVLRAMGYQSGTDFRWDAAWELADLLGITGKHYNAESKFDRGDVAITSLAALDAPVKQEGRTLLERLEDKDGVKNVMYEDQFLRITFNGMEQIPGQYGDMQALIHFNVLNKGGTFFDGIEYPKLWVSGTDVSLNGTAYSFTGLSTGEVVVSAGKEQELTVMVELNGALDGLQNLSARFRVYHGRDSEKDRSYNNWEESHEGKAPGDTFRSAGETAAYFGMTGLNGTPVNTASPAVPEWYDIKVYSDDNLDIYTSGFDGIWADFCIRNKTDKLLELHLKDFTVGGKQADSSFFLFTMYEDAAVLPYSTGTATVSSMFDSSDVSYDSCIYPGVTFTADFVNGPAYDVVIADPAAN